MITMTDQHAATDHLLEAIEMVLAPVRAISKAANVQLAPFFSAVGAIDAALYPQRLMAETVAASTARFIPVQYFQAITPVLPAFHAWTPVAPLLVSTPLVDIADQWRALVANILRPAVQLAGEVARWMHTALIEDAEHAHAVLCTDPDIRRRKAAVEEFAVHWIGVGKQTPERRKAILDAVEDVLLSACWRAPDHVADLALGKRLRTRVHAEARWHRPIWDNRSRSYAIDLLDRPVGRAVHGEPVTLAQQLVEPRDPYVLLEGRLDAQQRLRQVMALLKPEHRRVVLQRAYGDGVTWQEAALMAGLPAEAGERARRRVRRLTLELQRRQLG